MTIIRDEHAATPGLAIIDKYEEAVTYLYPILQRCPRVHGNVRDTMMAVLFDQVGLFYQAAKSRQPSKLYAADANLATLRFWLRFAADRRLKIISTGQHKAMLRLLAEVGAMLGAWIKTAKGNG
ncbi:diversity-generating retroelement protein Avd [Mesorhizobium sp. B2-3-4]|uniref:diversity-generating retroelement protein Avd n=1 Tax=Mesorhizobium sp. B2-3-4 TaxID=2589959 RepID=UPI00112B02DC|nr:diversity-generating retroelement protein Avd [Mesorhizobium sp. B2-3-4]TPM41581.1 diversity-generating retroelement protein Avd [Mesorhizobium sp. B2-3-4]